MRHKSVLQLISFYMSAYMNFTQGYYKPKKKSKNEMTGWLGKDATETAISLGW